MSRRRGHGEHLHVQAVLPGAVVSNIFESAGGVDADAGQDTAVAEEQRAVMLAIKATAMDPLAAAETVFEQAAEGRLLPPHSTVGRRGHGGARECACRTYGHRR